MQKKTNKTKQVKKKNRTKKLTHTHMQFKFAIPNEH